MSVADVVEKKGIKELLHFTTNRGALGILAAKAIKSRARLGSDPMLEKIFYPNAADRRRDAAWHDHVNLSITAINERFFSISANNWHRDKGLWWAIFSVDPQVMGHENVYFATTNNMYSGVKQAAGVTGLEALFAPNIVQWSGKVVSRSALAPENVPTCNQAEVLYPGQVSTDYVLGIYVHSEIDADELAGQVAAVGHRELPISVRPDLFGAIK